MPLFPKQIAHLAALHAGSVDRHRTLETRAKIRAGMLGKKNAEGCVRSPETQAKLRAGKLGSNNPMFGKHHSEEAIAKLRAASTNPGAETRAKMCAAQMGNKKAEGHIDSSETRAKKRAAHLGHKNSQWGKRGPETSRWLGGISRDPYGWEFNDELKEEVRRRDGHRCQLCGVPQAECKAALPVHHIDYDKKNSDPVNLTALCKSCHSKTNTNRKHWTAFFQAKALKRDIATLNGSQ